ncbi:uncharacterized protein [Amphiura filiformis]|uniref:uncharacterized protein n=1 Tax=Amphiura filiformis TaxID=82378 RepID=UPI003B20CCD9
MDSRCDASLASPVAFTPNTGIFQEPACVSSMLSSCTSSECGDGWECCSSSANNVTCNITLSDNPNKIRGTCTDYAGCTGRGGQNRVCCYKVVCECKIIPPPTPPPTTTTVTPSTSSRQNTDIITTSKGSASDKERTLPVTNSMLKPGMEAGTTPTKSVIHSTTENPASIAAPGSPVRSTNGITIGVGIGVGTSLLLLVLVFIGKLLFCHRQNIKQAPDQPLNETQYADIGISPYSTYLPDMAEDSNNLEEQQYDDTGIEMTPNLNNQMEEQYDETGIEIHHDNMGYQSLGADKDIPNYQELKKKPEQVVSSPDTAEDSNNSEEEEYADIGISSYSTYLPDTAEYSNNPEEQQYDDTGIEVTQNPNNPVEEQYDDTAIEIHHDQKLSRKDSDSESYEKVTDPKLDNQAQPTDNKSQATITNEAQSSGDEEYAECGPATTEPLPNTSPVNPPSHPSSPKGNAQDTDIAYGNQTVINHRNQRLGKNLKMECLLSAS